MNRIIKALFLLLVVASFSFSDLLADQKQFARSYTAYTLPANALEFEFWQRGNIGKENGYFYQWKPRFEIEYGVTDRLTASMYFNLEETKSSENNFESEPLSFSTTSVELRYRLSNPNQYWIDPALYFELSYGGSEISYEPKLILSKRMGEFISVLNISSEIERNPMTSETVSDFEIGAGLAYELNKNVSIGIELSNHRNFSSILSNETGSATFIGPTISFKTDRLYLVMNLMPQVSGSPAASSGLDLIGHEKYEFRTILGIEL